MPAVFRSPRDLQSTNCAYFAVVGPEIRALSSGGDFGTSLSGEAALRGGESGLAFMRTVEPTDLLSITDGLSYAIGLVEAKRDFPWTKNFDIWYTDDKPFPEIGGWHENGFHAAFADGEVRFILTDHFDEQAIRRLFTISDGHHINLNVFGDAVRTTDGVAPRIGPKAE